MEAPYIVLILRNQRVILLFVQCIWQCQKSTFILKMWRQELAVEPHCWKQRAFELLWPRVRDLQKLNQEKENRKIIWFGWLYQPESWPGRRIPC